MEELNAALGRPVEQGTISIGRKAVDSLARLVHMGFRHTVRVYPVFAIRQFTYLTAGGFALMLVMTYLGGFPGIALDVLSGGRGEARVGPIPAVEGLIELIDLLPLQIASVAFALGVQHLYLRTRSQENLVRRTLTACLSLALVIGLTQVVVILLRGAYHYPQDPLDSMGPISNWVLNPFFEMFPQATGSTPSSWVLRQLTLMYLLILISQQDSFRRNYPQLLRTIVVSLMALATILLLVRVTYYSPRGLFETGISVGIFCLYSWLVIATVYIVSTVRYRELYGPTIAFMLPYYVMFFIYSLDAQIWLYVTVVSMAIVTLARIVPPVEQLEARFGEKR